MISAMPRAPIVERSVGELFGDLASETTTLVRHEVRLATMELAQKAAYAGRQVAFIAAGSLLGVVSLVCLIGALVLGLGTLIPIWVSALAVGVAVAATAYGVSQIGIAKLKAMDTSPTQTVESIREGKLWVQEQIR
jgi:cytochrome c biogenesis protein CcdA